MRNRDATPASPGRHHRKHAIVTLHQRLQDVIIVKRAEPRVVRAIGRVVVVAVTPSPRRHLVSEAHGLGSRERGGVGGVAFVTAPPRADDWHWGVGRSRGRRGALLLTAGHDHRNGVLADRGVPAGTGTGIGTGTGLGGPPPGREFRGAGARRVGELLFAPIPTVPETARPSRLSTQLQALGVIRDTHSVELTRRHNSPRRRRRRRGGEREGGSRGRVVVVVEVVLVVEVDVSAQRDRPTTAVAEADVQVRAAGVRAAAAAAARRRQRRTSPARRRPSGLADGVRVVGRSVAEEEQAAVSAGVAASEPAVVPAAGEGGGGEGGGQGGGQGGGEERGQGGEGGRGEGGVQLQARGRQAGAVRSVTARRLTRHGRLRLVGRSVSLSVGSVTWRAGSVGVGSVTLRVRSGVSVRVRSVIQGVGSVTWWAGSVTVGVGGVTWWAGSVTVGVGSVTWWAGSVTVGRVRSVTLRVKSGVRLGVRSVICGVRSVTVGRVRSTSLRARSVTWGVLPVIVHGTTAGYSLATKEHWAVTVCVREFWVSHTLPGCVTICRVGEFWASHTLWGCVRSFRLLWKLSC